MKTADFTYTFGSPIKDFTFTDTTYNGVNGFSYNLKRSYRFGFNDKELDEETSTYDYGFRIYNPSIGRFLSVDPLMSSYPWYTPYQFAGNMPIWAIDLDGLEEKKKTDHKVLRVQRGDFQQKTFTPNPNRPDETITPYDEIIQQGDEGADIVYTFETWNGNTAGSSAVWQKSTSGGVCRGCYHSKTKGETTETNLVQKNDAETPSAGEPDNSSVLTVPNTDGLTPQTTPAPTPPPNPSPAPAVTPAAKPKPVIPFNGQVLKKNTTIPISDNALGWFSVSTINGGTDPATGKVPKAGDLTASGKAILNNLAKSINSMKIPPTSINLSINGTIGAGLSFDNRSFALNSLELTKNNAINYLNSKLKNPIAISGNANLIESTEINNSSNVTIK